MKISRVVGTTGELVPIFVQDATVSTGNGFPNLEISTFSSYYYRSDMTSTSSVTLVSTGTLGTWSSGQFLQINSTFMRGWYQFCLPDGVWAAGSTCALHMYGHPSMAPVVMELDILRFNNQVTSVTVRPVNVSTFNSRVGVSSFGIDVGVSSFNVGLRVGVSTAVDVSSFSANAVTVTEGNLTVDVSTFFGSRTVTTAAGVLGVGRVGVSSIDQRVGVSSFGLAVGISSIPIGVSTSWFSGAGIVTTEAGRLSVDVSSIMGTKAVTTVQGYFPTHMDLSLTLNSTSTVNWSSFFIGAQSVTVGAVDVTSFAGNAVTVTEGKLTVDVSTFHGSRAVTTAAGVLAVGRVGVSSIDQRVGVSSIDQRVGVSSIGVGVSTSWFSGAGVVTTEAGRLSVDVSSIMGTKAVTSVAGYFPVYWDLELTRNQNSTVAFSSVSFSTLYSSVSASVGSVDISSIYGSAIVTSVAGVIAAHVTSFGIRVGVSSINQRVGVSSIDQRVGVSSIDQRVGVSTAVDVTSYSGNAVTVTEGKLTVDVSTFFGSRTVTTAAGILSVGRVGVSSFGLPVGASSFDVGLQVGVSSFNSRVGVSSFDLPVGVSSFDVPLQVGVSSFNSRVGVSSFGIEVGVSSNPIGVNITSVTGIAVTGVGTSSDPWNP